MTGIARDEAATEPQSYGRTLTLLAAEAPERVALVCDDQAMTRRELECRANRLAHAYHSLGVRPGDIVTLCLPNGCELVSAMFATWKLGAVPNPLSARLPSHERAAIVDRAKPSLIVGVETGVEMGVETGVEVGVETGVETSGAGIGVQDAVPCLPAGYAPSESTSADPPPDCIPPHERALASGGSTGLPKLIIPKSPALYSAETASPIFRARNAALVPGPLHHAAPFSACFQALLAGCKVVLMSRFDASLFLDLVERHRIDRVTLVPTMMQRIWRLPEQERLARDVSSLEFVMSGGAPLPAWLMQAWIEWLGAEVMHEAFGPSERIGGTFITGSEWLAHPGSVGRPNGTTRIRILDDDGADLPSGEMGEIYMLPATGPGSTYRYVGADSRTTADGWESVGDMGYLDADGYLYLGDRRSDMIVCGGVNIYPAEVEAAIDAHPGVRSSAVIGLPDADLGRRIHAIVEAEGLDAQALLSHLAETIARHKIPRSIEFVTTPLRDDAGKLRRAQLSAERS
jgi:bile acid-coenzyme A ligase